MFNYDTNADYETNLENAFEQRREKLQIDSCDAVANGDWDAYELLQEQLLDLNLTELGYGDVVDEVYWSDAPEKAHWEYSPSEEADYVNDEISHENDYVVTDDNSDYEINPYNNGTVLEDLENFVPDETNDIYNAEEAMEHWECQGDTNRCAQFSQLFVIEEFLNIDIDPNEFCQYSEEHGWFSEDNGTDGINMNKMLDEFGIPNEMSQGKSFEDLLNCLENGGRVIVGVDAGEYAYGEGYWDDYFDPYNPDHAIEVIGFDPETNSVIVNDSGHPAGCGEKIPLETFLDAWDDSHNFMIECYNPNTAVA